MRRELIFLGALWKANLLASMEYRASFLSQVLGMMLNNAVYFCFWLIFFDRFKAIRGWGLNEMLLLFGIVAVAYGLVAYLFGNAMSLADVIVNGELDYYLSLPRPVLVHVLASRSHTSGLGDLTYGLISFALARPWSIGATARFALASLLGMVVFLSFMVLVQSLAFWIGNTSLVTNQALNAIMTFSLYPLTLFDGSAKLILFTVIPAAFVGAVPAEYVRGAGWAHLAELVGATSFFLVLAALVFSRGLRRYESGSAIQVRAWR